MKAYASISDIEIVIRDDIAIINGEKFILPQGIEFLPAYMAFRYKGKIIIPSIDFDNKISFDIVENGRIVDNIDNISDIDILSEFTSE